MGIRLRSLTTPAVMVAVCALLAASCTTSDGEPAVSGPNPAPGGGSVTGLEAGAPVLLRSADSCDAVAGEFRRLVDDGAVLGRHGFAGGPWAIDVAIDDAEAASGGLAAGADGVASTGAAGRASSTSDTNTHEEGIDEPDVVETDSAYVYLIDTMYDPDRDGERLVILDGATAEIVGTLGLAGWGTQLLLHGDRLLAISGGGFHTFSGPIGIEGDGPGTGPDIDDQEPAGGEPVPIPVDPPSFEAGTTLTLIDVSDRSAPRVVESTELEGHHVSTRVVDGVARVVISSYPGIGVAIDEVIHTQLGSSERDWEDAISEASTQAAAEATISDWLPSYRTTTLENGELRSVEGDAVPCTNVLMPEVNAGLAETSILRVGFDTGFDPSATTTVVAEAQTVYASAQTLYIAASRYVSPDAQGRIATEDWSTAIHAFDLTGAGAAPHSSAGEVPGSLLNQYSMSEHNGDLRVATTEGTPRGDDADSESGVRVLRRIGDSLDEIGSVTGLGVTETIQSVRFMGDTGYVVTFRQIDPLYVIDLSDPTSPQATGELKIPGFSSYLHPVSEDRLIGLGRDADEETGEDRGLLISLFDVSDPTNPRQIQTFTERFAYSEASWDPQAFLWWAPESALAIPVERETGFAVDSELGEVFDPAAYDYSSTISVFAVSDGGITLQASVEGPGEEQYASRALVVQGRLWSLFNGGVAVADFGDLGNPSFHRFP